MWENILKMDFNRAIAIPIMQEIYDSGIHPQTIYRKTSDFEALRHEFLHRYSEEVGGRLRGKFKNAIRHNETKYDNTIVAYANATGFEILASKRRRY